MKWQSQVEITVEADEIKTLTFPLGTKIKILEKNENIFIHKSGGIKNGKHLLFLNIYSKERSKITIYYNIQSKKIFNSYYDFLIITPSVWKEILTPLNESKEKYGIKTFIVGIEEIYNNKYFECNGRDDAEKIKYFIKNAIEEWGIKYVLLVGGRKPGMKEEWWLPVRYSWLNDRSSSWEYERKFMSDLYFADIYDGEGNFSSWDTNNNGYYGEYDHEIYGMKFSDEVDLFPDVYIGRLAVRSGGELRRVINNIIEYEKNTDESFRNAVLCGGDLYLNDPWDIPEGEYLLNKISECMKGFKIKKIYASNGLNSKKINSVIEEGAGIVVFEGAGNHHLWATHEKDSEKWIYYYEWNIMQLKNEYKPIVLASGARLGQFNRTRECFNWFFVSKGKAVATIGPTGLCWIGHGKNVTEMFLGNLHIRLCSKIGKAELLGDAWGDAITQYLCNFSWRGVAKAFHMKAVEETEIFGDPTLKIGGYASKINFNRTLHVGGDGANNYTRIQDAIDNASDGDIIIVHSGIYNENLFIDKSLAIFGRDAKIKTEGIFLYAPKIKIEGFSIEGHNRGEGIVCYGGNSSIKNNKIYSFNTSIMVYGNDCIICENEIKNSECGIWIDSSCNSEILDNKIHNNWYGLWGEYAENIHVMNNNFSYNEWYAVWMEGKNGNISNNNFHRNWYSIYLYNSLNFSIYSNRIKRNIHGPQFVNSSFNSFLNNNVERNEHYGIYFGWRSKENVITKNNFIENAQNARDDGKNWFNSNYWDDYIGLKIKILAYLHLPYYIPKFSFDWNPQLSYPHYNNIY